MAIGDVINSITAGTGSVFWTIILIVVVGGIGLIIIGLGAWYFFAKRRWNLKVEIKLPRSGAGIIVAEWGKGRYDVKKGVVFIKRKKSGVVPMEVFDLKEYLQGDNIITVIQIGPDTYKPISPKSWTEHSVTYINEKTKEEKEVKESILNIKMDTGLNKAWKSAWTASAKRAYSLQSFMQQFQTPIAIGIVVVSVFVGFAIIWARLGIICS